MIKKTKRYSIQIILLLFTIYTTAQTTPANIVKGSINTPYTVAKTESETLIATQSIVLSPNTFIKSGSTFLAKINSDQYIPPFLSKENFIFTRKYQRNLKSNNDIANNSDVMESVTYYDGLGRPMQNIAIKGSPNKNDIVTHIAYDNIGRQEKEYLPYMDNTGSVSSYRNSIDAETRTNDYYKLNYPQDVDNLLPNPFSQKKFDNSPLNRVLLQAAPGKDWALNSGHEIKLDYQTNSASAADEIKFYVVTTALNSEGVYVPAVTSTINYSDNQLYKTITKDENWVSGKNNTTEEFKNKEGQVILKRTYANYGDQTEVKHDTYYIYDTYGNLTYVLPPKAEGAITQPILNDLCYQYKYDNRNRLVEKKLPGRQWEFIVYDKLDRPVATGPAFSPLGGDTIGWLITKYDILKRPIYTGWYAAAVTTATRASLQNDQNNLTTANYESKTSSGTINGITAYYTNTVAPTSFMLLTVNYYDDYNFPNAPSPVPASVLSDNSQAVYYNNTQKPIGLPTGSWVRVLNGSTSDTYILYDSKARPIRTYTKGNDLWPDSYTYVDTKIDFSGKVLLSETKHNSAPGSEIKITEVFTYSPQGQLLTHTHQVNTNTPQLLADNSYDELGRLISKKVGNNVTTPLQTVDYTYNIRGWLKGINDTNTSNAAITMGSNDLFGFQINYNNPTSGTSLYNGNISQTFWKTANTDTSLKNYTYTYDALNRLTNATDNLGLFNEGLSYDKNGNITNLTRKGEIVGGVPSITIPSNFGLMDNLTYTYDGGNKLQIVSDGANDTYGFKDDFIGPGADTTADYTYDDNGNMQTDINKGITAIKYNHLNLPVTITFGTTAIITYIYDANGQKVRKQVFDSSTGRIPVITFYSNGFQYIYNGNQTGGLQFVPTAEGYYDFLNSKYVFNYTDHLGNVRLSYGDSDNDGIINSSNEIIEENNYYPFGLKHKGYNNVKSASNYKYKFQGQELQDELGLGWYSYKWRNYDPAIGRFMCIDPLTEKYEDYTPYQFSSNQPVHAKELEGLESSNDLNKKTPTQRAYNPKTGNTDLAVLVVETISDVIQSINTYTTTTDKEVTSTAISKNGGGENQKSTGKKTGDNISADAFLTGAPGSASKGNNLAKTKDFIKAVKDINSMFKKGQKVGDGVNEVIKENSKGGETKPEKTEYVQTVSDPKNSNNNEYVRKDVYDAQQKRK